MAQLAEALIQRVHKVRDVISCQASIRATYLFGSQVWGTPDEYSDTDVAVFCDGVEDWDLRRRAEAIADVQCAVGDDIELHVFPASLLPIPPAASFARLIVDKGLLVD